MGEMYLVGLVCVSISVGVMTCAPIGWLVFGGGMMLIPTAYFIRELFKGE